MNSLFTPTISQEIQLYSIIYSVVLLIFAIQPKIHAEQKQRKTTVEIRKFIFKHVFNAISKFQPDKTCPKSRLSKYVVQVEWRINRICRRTEHIQVKSQARYFMIIQEQALTSGR
ncbi:Hypothetical_protein [Hexamita inflata]|uniref:Hypothetical_protein n=1 Tax=Hexamita inflata TaxID=28002 RepID=A0ABP1IL12_9EUKA